MKKTIPLGSRRAGALVFILALGLAAVCPAAEDTWIRKANMPTARYVHSSSIVDGKIYLIGGAASEPGSELIFPVEVYDPTVNSWTQKASIPTGRVVLSTCVVYGKIYAIGGVAGGLTGLSAVEEYDPSTDTWVRKASLPTPRGALSASEVNGKIYVMGGTLSLNNLVGLSTVEEYDPAADHWTRKADMPTPRFALSTSVVDGQIYAIGGGTQSPGRAIVEAYDPATDTWTRKADMPTARRNLATCVVGRRIYAIGGWERSTLYAYTAVERYDPSMNMWTIETNLPEPRACLSASTVNGKIYAIGGTDRSHPCPALSSVYELTISAPPPDFNGDGVVDIKDLLRLIHSWGGDDPSCDIAPPPFGDGVVDVLDLELLMSYWGQQVDDPTLVAHWALDETEGPIAYDGAGENDASVSGEPVWQPEAGMVGGALAFDGVDDYIFAPNGLNPADGPFSVFAWIQGGAPGQVVISQLNGADWLSADPASGFLMTALCESGRSGSSLKSESVITDGDWHRIGFVWDGMFRALYVDDILAAEDTQQGLGGATGGLNIGCGMNSAAGTFWSGLIDEIRIYNRSLSP